MPLTPRPILYGHHSPSITEAGCQTCPSEVPTALNDSDVLRGRGKMSYYTVKHLREIKGSSLYYMNSHDISIHPPVLWTGWTPQHELLCPRIKQQGRKSPESEVM